MLTPDLMAIRKNRKVGQYSTRAGLHVTPLEELADKHKRGGRAWRAQFIGGLPMLGDLTEPGVRPMRPDAGEAIAREEPLGGWPGRGYCCSVRVNL